MNVLYLSQRFGLETSGIFADLVRALHYKGHLVTVVTCQPEGSGKLSSEVIFVDGIKIITVKSPRLFSYNKFEKGIAQLLLPRRMISAIKQHLSGLHFDLILYPTPPITLASVVSFCKKEFKARSFLMLKDIFPQNAVDLGLMRFNGLLHRYFKLVEKDLYNVSDIIGCMTAANISYLEKNYHYLSKSKLTYFPNTLDCKGLIGRNFKAPRESTKFVFGGNLGLPQDIPKLLKNISLLPNSLNAEFIFIGDGFYKLFIKNFIAENPQLPIKYVDELTRLEFDKFLERCDVGLVSLNSSFTVPNCPARILSYMAKGLPILAMVDDATDLQEILESNAKCGYCCSSRSSEGFIELVEKFCNLADLNSLGLSGQKFLKNNFNVNQSVAILEKLIER